MSDVSSTVIRQQDLDKDYGWSRFPETQDRIPYGRFRNVYLYITEKCQLRCAHCYMGERLERAKVMPLSEVQMNLRFWRRMGGSKLTLLGGEATLHPQFSEIVRYAHKLSYEKVILTTNGLRPAMRVLAKHRPEHFAYIQVSLDGGSAKTHENIRGRGTFDIAWETIETLCRAGFDTRIICTVNQANMSDCLDLLSAADRVGVSLVKYHVFSGIGYGSEEDDLLVSPREWVEFCDELERQRDMWKSQLWYQPTYVRRKDFDRYVEQGYRGCIGRTLDRISVFPDGRAYICSYLFDTDLHFAMMGDEMINLNKGPNELELFTEVLGAPGCGENCVQSGCMGGCPAEKLVMGGSSCVEYPDLVPVCRLWKADI